MEPLRDDELDRMLRQGEPDWKPSPELDDRVRERYRRRPWEWLWRGSIRIPVPVAVVILAALGFLVWNRGGRERQVDIDLNHFRPVEKLEIKLVRNANANQ